MMAEGPAPEEVAGDSKPKQEWEIKLEAELDRLQLPLDSEKKCLRVLVTGRTGAGKSALVQQHHWQVRC